MTEFILGAMGGSAAFWLSWHYTGVWLERRGSK